MRADRRYRVRGVIGLGLLVLALVGVLATARAAQGQESQPPPLETRPISVVLLIDTSGSMGNTDPAELRERAAEYLVDFLAANGEALNLNYRLGAAAFNHQVMPYSVRNEIVSVVDLTTLFGLTPSGDTDFLPALKYAEGEMNAESTGNQKLAVVIFTDGRPERDGQPITDPNYFDVELRKQVDALKAMGSQVFVVGIGDAVEDREKWQSLLDEGSFVSIDNPRDLYRVYSTWFSKLIGLEAIGGGERLEDYGEESFPVDPFLEQLVVTAIKDDPTAVVTLSRPDGSVEPLPESQQGKAHAVYTIDDPVDGQWTISVTGGGMDYYVWRLRPSLTLTGFPEYPLVGSGFLVTTEGLSDRISEAGDAVQLELIGHYEGQEFVRQVMQRDLQGQFIAGIPNSFFAEPGDYTFTVDAFVNDGELADLNYQPLKRTFILPPTLVVHVNDELIAESGQQVQFDPGAEMRIEIAITQADLLGDDLRLTLRLPGQPPYDLDPSQFQDDPARGSRVYESTFILGSNQNAASLEVSLKGTTNQGVSINDSRTVDLAPRPVAPTVTSTLEVTVVATMTPPVGITPTIEGDGEEGSSAPSLSWLPWGMLALMALVVIGVGGWQIVQRLQDSDEAQMLRRQRVNETLKGQKKAQKENDRPGNLNSTALFFEKLEQSETQVLDEGRQDADTVLQGFIEFFSKDENYDRLYEDLGKLSRKMREGQTRRMLDFAQLLFARAWVNQDQFIAVEGLYRLLQQGLPTEDFISALAKEDTTRRGLLFGALINAIKNPNAANLALVKVQSNNLESEEKGGYSAVYQLLEVFYSSPAFKINKSQFDSVIRELDKHGPDILGRLFTEVRDSMFPRGSTEILPNGDRRESHWRDTIKMLSLARRVTDKVEYNGIPEANFLQLRIDVLQQIAEQERKLFRSTTGVGTKSGQLLYEIRPSLDLFTSHEFRGESIQSTWDKIQIPIIAYHIGATRVPSAKITTAIHSAKADLKGPTGEFDIEVNGIELVTLDFTSIVEEPSLVEIKSLYDTEKVSGRNALRKTKTEQVPKDICHSFGIAPKRSWRQRSELRTPHIFDRPLTKEERDVLDMELDLPVKLSESVRNLVPGIQLLSLSGLRRTGKTTVLNAFCEELSDLNETSRSNPAFLTIEFDLMTWLDKTPLKEGDNEVIPFWKELLRLLASGIKNSRLKEQHGLPEQLEQWNQELHDGRWKLALLLNELNIRLRQFADAAGVRIILIFDEADLFTYFGHEELYRELAKLSGQGNVIVLVCHDAIDAKWFESLENAFDYEAENMANGAKRFKRDYFQQFKTMLLDEEDAMALLKKGELEYTDLALKTAWTLTGGYETLVQLIGHYLIYKRQPKGTDNQEIWTDVVVTGDEVKDVAYHFSARITNLIEYLGQSFSPEEYLLMHVMAQDHLDLDTGLLIDIRFRLNPPSIDYWENTEALLYNLSIQFPAKFDQERLERVLTSLRQKQILEQVIVEGEQLPYVRWRVGWFVRFLRDNAEADLSPLIGLIEPVEKQITA